MARTARLKDVAAAADLSPATVSRHLNGSLRLPDTTRRRIEEAVVRLGYRPNPHARSLSLGRSDLIGLVLPELANPFFARLADAVERAAHERGVGLLLCTTSNQPDRELDYLRRLRGQHMDGLLFLTNHADDGTLAAAIDAAERVVLLDEDVPGTAVPRVLADNERGGWLGARRLLDAGHRALAAIGGPPGLLSTAERSAGFRRAVREQPDAAVTAEFLGAYTREHGRAAARRLLTEAPHTTAVFTANDEILIGLLEVLDERGLSVPGHLSVVTFDDAGPLHLFKPAVTAVRQDVAGMGRHAVALLLAAGRTPAGSSARIGVSLVERASVGPPRLG